MTTRGPAAGPGAEVGQLRLARLLPQGVELPAVSVAVHDHRAENRLREHIAGARPVDLRARPDRRQQRQHQRAPRRRLAADPDQRLAGQPRPGADRQARLERRADRRRSAVEGGVPAPGDVRRAQRRRRHRAPALDPFRRGVLHGRPRSRQLHPAADRLLRDEDRPAAADPVLPARRSGARRRDPRARRQAPRGPAGQPRSGRLRLARWRRRSTPSKNWRKRPSCSCCCATRRRGR